MPDQQEMGLKAHWKCMLAISLVTLSPFQYGLDFGIIGGLQAMVGFLEVFGRKAPETKLGWNIPTGRQQMISSLMVLGAFIGSSSAGFTARFYGRRMSLFVASVIVIVSAVIMQTTTSIGGLYFGRIFIGVGNGLLMTHSQLYIQECSPAKWRGLAIAVFQAWVSVGTVLGKVVDNETAYWKGRRSYQVPLAVIYIVPGILILTIFLIPESPRYLLMQGREEKAKKALYWLRPTEWRVEEEMGDMKHALDIEKDMQSGVGVLDLFKNPIDRRRTLLCIAVISTHGATGVMYVLAFGTYFFAMANIGKPFENSVTLTGSGVAAILINSLIITKWGRRRVFMITGLIGCGATQLIMAAIYSSEPGTEKTGRAVVAFTVMYLVILNCFISTYAWLAGGEMPSQRLRSLTFGFGSAIGFLAGWLCTFTAPYFINTDALDWGPRYGYIWAASNWFTAIVLFFFLPETKDRTLEEIDEMFEARLPARKFRKYKCTILAHKVEDNGSESEKKKSLEQEKMVVEEHEAEKSETGSNKKEKDQ